MKGPCGADEAARERAQGQGAGDAEDRWRRIGERAGNGGGGRERRGRDRVRPATVVPALSRASRRAPVPGSRICDGNNQSSQEI